MSDDNQIGSFVQYFVSFQQQCTRATLSRGSSSMRCLGGPRWRATTVGPNAKRLHRIDTDIMDISSFRLANSRRVVDLGPLLQSE